MYSSPIDQFKQTNAHCNPILGWSDINDVECQVQGLPKGSMYRGKILTKDQAYRNTTIFNGISDLVSYISDWVPEYVTLYGESGLDPINRQSLWFGADIDSIIDHGQTTGQSTSMVDEIIEKCSELAYVQVQRSKGGEGIHLYGRCDPDNRPAAGNRIKHRLNAKRWLMRIEQDTGLSLLGEGKPVDAYGGNMWLWTADLRKKSFDTLSEATECIPKDLPELPPETPRYAKNNIEDVELDDDHKRIIDAWDITKYAVIPATTDSGQLFFYFHTHAALKADIDIIGEFDTDSPGNNPCTPNAMAFLRTAGGFLFQRLNNADECSPWHKSENGNTVCLYNIAQDIETVARRHDIKRHDGGWIGTVAELAYVLKTADGTIVDTTNIESRSASLTRDDGQYVLKTSWKSFDGNPPPGWHWPPGTRSIIFATDAPPVAESDPRIKSQQVYSIIGDVDGDGIREAENFIRIENDEIVTYTHPKLDHALKQDGLNRDQRNHVMLTAPRLRRRVAHFRDLIEDGWLNIGAKLPPYHPGEHPTWDALDNHAFAHLTDHLSQWYHDNGITTGGLFARLWTCLMIREHQHPLPMLSLYSKQQGTGKTAWAHSRKILLIGGASFGNNVFARNSQFNAHVLRAVYAHIEECDIRKCYDQIKPLISDDEAEQEAKHVQASTAPNRCHFVQTSNHLEYCPIDPDDCRIIIVKVNPIPEPIVKKELQERLEAELPHYLNTLMTMDYPDPAPGLDGRLWLPIVNTPERKQLMEMRDDPLRLFIEKHCEPGKEIPSREFDQRFQKWNLDMIGECWSSQQIHRALPEHRLQYVVGSGNKGIIKGVKWIDRGKV